MCDPYPQLQEQEKRLFQALVAPLCRPQHRQSCHPNVRYNGISPCVSCFRRIFGLLFVFYSKFRRFDLIPLVWNRAIRVLAAQELYVGLHS